MQNNEKSALDLILQAVSKEMDCFRVAYRDQYSSDVAFLKPVMEYVGQMRGKHLRPLLFFLVQGLLGRPQCDSASVAVMLELLHTASLIHDDVVDDAEERRGNRSLNALWGSRVSVLIGDFLFAKVLELGVNNGQCEPLHVISRVVAQMGRGELWQALEGDGRLISVNEYIALIRDKTASLFAASCELGGVVFDADADTRDRLHRFGELYGLAFQIQDDILDYNGEADRLGKPVGQDVGNGEITLPLIYTMQSLSVIEQEDVIERLRRHDVEDLTLIYHMVASHDGIAKARDQAESYSRQASDVLQTFPVSPYRDHLEQLVALGMERVA